MTTTPEPGIRPPALLLDGIQKSFGSVVALRSGTIEVRAGSIHALVGENGAGKSTLVKIIAGLYRRDGGIFRLEGTDVDFTSTAESKAAGVAVIYQEPTLFPDLSVTENVFMGRQPVGRFGRIDRKAMRAEVEAVFLRLGVRIDPDRPAEGLSIADQQVIEIAKAISLDAKVLIMDEPTAALSGVEVDRLFQIARSLRDEGRALVFISHRFDEVFDLCDTVTVMRDGAYISTNRIVDTSVDEIVTQMVGREITDLFPKQETAIGAPLLEVEGLTSAGVFHDISLTVRSGEIVGLAGLVGAGRSEVARAIFGVDGYDSGTVRLAGRPVPMRNASAALRRGLALVPEDRRKQGLVLDSSVSQNLTLAIRSRLAKAGIITSGFENRAARVWASRLEVKASALSTTAGTLSGGNQQKVVLGKWLATRACRAHHRRTDARHRCRHEGGGAPPALGARQPGHGDPHDLLGAARGARHGRPCARHARGPHHGRDRTRGCDIRECDVRRDPRDGRPLVSTATRIEKSSVTKRFAAVSRAREFGILIALVIVVIAATVANPNFLFSADGWRDLLLTPSILVLVAVGQAIVLITRNVDLSVGSVLGLTAYLTGRLFIDVPGIPILVVFVHRGRLRRPARAHQRGTRGVRASAGDGHHPRHALRLPRHQRAVDGQ